MGERGVRTWRKPKNKLTDLPSKRYGQPVVIARPKLKTWKRL